jgi:hypothetical protein
MRSEVICGECWIELGGIDCRCAGAARSGQNSLPDPLESKGSEGSRAAEAGASIARGCAGECAACGCGGTEGEGE